MQKLHLIILLMLVTGLSACGNTAMKLNQQKINTVQADALNTQGFALQLLETLKDSNANSIVSMVAHPGKPIIIDAARFDVRKPVDLVAIFNSEAFRRDWGAIFPPTKNGWDAFIATVDALKSVATKDTPWLAYALNSAMKRVGNNFSGDNNSVASDGSAIDQSDSSNNSDNSDNSDNSTTTDTVLGDL